MYLIKNVDVIFIIIKYKYIHTLLSEPVLHDCYLYYFLKLQYNITNWYNNYSMYKLYILRDRHFKLQQ